MSNIGRDDRYLWNVVNNPGVAEELTPNTHVKFMYGHLIEELLLFLTRLAGHEVTDEQKRCEVSALQGLWTVRLMVLSLMLSLCPLLGLRNSRTEVWLLTTRLGTLLKVRVMHIQGRRQPFWLVSDGQTERTLDVSHV